MCVMGGPAVYTTAVEGAQVEEGRRSQVQVYIVRWGVGEKVNKRENKGREMNRDGTSG